MSFVDENEVEVLDADQGVSDEPAEQTVEQPVEQPVEQTTEPAAEKEQETPEIDWDNIDPNTLPPEVQKYYKGMQASYTRKMQGLSQALEGLKTHSVRLQLLDRAIAGDPEAQEQLARFVQRRPQPEASDDEIPAEFSDTKHLVSFFDQRVQKAVQQAMQSIGQQIAPIQQHAIYQQQMAEYHAVKAKYPDFDSYIPQMIEIRNRMPGIDLESAYKLATYKAPVPPSKLVSKPGARPSATKTKASDKPMSWEEAAEAAINQLKKGR